MHESSSEAGPWLTGSNAQSDGTGPLVRHLDATETMHMTYSLAAAPVRDESLHRAIRGAAAWMSDPRVLIGLARRVLVGRPDEATRLVEDALRQHGISDHLVASAIWLGKPRAVLGLARRVTLAGRQATEGYVVIALERSLRTPDAATGPGTAPQLGVGVDTVHEPLDSGGATAEDAALCAEQRATIDGLTSQLAALQTRFTALEEAKLADEKALLEADLTIARLRGAIR